MIDLLYPLNKSSRWQDNELRFSLRSVEKHLTNVRNVYVVGECPNFLRDVIHVTFGDGYQNKERNIYEKVLHACQLPGLSENFLFMNDDHFLLHDFDAVNFPTFHKADLSVAAQSMPEHSYYRKSLLRTISTLCDLGLPTVNFDTHCPILYNKWRFLSVMPQYDWTNTYGFTVKSMYCNTLRIQGTLEQDGKFNFIPLDQEQMINYTKDRKFFSIGDHAINHELAKFMGHLYPQTSRWEKLST